MNPLPDIQLYGYTDRGQVYTIEPAVGTADNTTAASAGGGVRLNWPKAVNFNVDLSAAKAIEGPRDDWRFFFITTARY